THRLLRSSLLPASSFGPATEIFCLSARSPRPCPLRAAACRRSGPRRGAAATRPTDADSRRGGPPKGARRPVPYCDSGPPSYLSSTVAPASSSFFLSCWASSLLTPSLTGFG